MTKKARVAPNLAIAGPFRSGAAVAPSEERCADLHAPRGAALCHTRLRVWQKSWGRGGKSPALLVSSFLNATRYKKWSNNGGQRQDAGVPSSVLRLPASVRCLIVFSLYSQRPCQLNQGVTLAPTAFALYLQEITTFRQAGRLPSFATISGQVRLPKGSSRPSRG
jgi:hypothetical protein